MLIARAMLPLPLLVLLRFPSNKEALGESPAEISLRAHVEKVLQENGQTMQAA